ncbi:MAG TPA: VOC family protein [Blastococcus sp.]|nr:VOC family protein [Blastococcus sp.]
MLELDHVLCMVTEAGSWARRLEAGGWWLDAGTAHPGQGTRNRRLIWDGQYLELAWIENGTEAGNNPLRLDRRADWRATGASPFGIGLRGRPAPAEEPAFWLYTDLGFPIWVHRDNEDRPERPLLFVLDLPARRGAGPARPEGRLLTVEHHGPAPADLPCFTGPSWTYRPGPHRLELFVDRGRPVEVSEHLSLRIAPPGHGPGP